MLHISPDDFKAFKEELFKELHHFNHRLQEIRDTIDHFDLLKGQNSEIPIHRENSEISSPAAISTENTPCAVSVATPWITPRGTVRIPENTRSQKLRSDFPKLTNRFEGLRIYDCNPEEYDIEWPGGETTMPALQNEPVKALM